MAMEDDVPITVTGNPLRPINYSIAAPSALNKFTGIDALGSTGGGAGIGASSYVPPDNNSRYRIGKVQTPVGNLPGVTVPVGNNASVGLGMNPLSNKIGANFTTTFKKGGAVKKAAPKKTSPKKMAKGGKVSSASRRGDGCAQRGKTKGRFV